MGLVGIRFGKVKPRSTSRIIIMAVRHRHGMCIRHFMVNKSDMGVGIFPKPWETVINEIVHSH